MNKTQESYHLWGKLFETKVMHLLNSIGYDVSESAFMDNYLHDIDLWSGEVGISVKHQDAALRTGNMSFEYSQLLVDATSPLSYVDGRQHDTTVKLQARWLPAWWQNGKAELYAIAVGEWLYVFPKADVSEWLEVNGGLYGGNVQRRPLSKMVQTSGVLPERVINARSFLMPMTALKSDTLMVNLSTKQTTTYGEYTARNASRVDSQQWTMDSTRVAA